MFKGRKCQRCEGKIKDSYDFCPYCGLDMRNPEKDMDDFGLLGKNNDIKGYPLAGGMGSFGITDRMINSIFKSLMKSMESQMKDLNPSDVENFPNGIKIRFGPAVQKKKEPKKVKKTITEEQIKRMSKLPRAEAKTNVRRLNDKVIYEIGAAGVEHVDDVFVSKLESGYEVKAIGKKKVYVNSIPVNLPFKGYRINEKGLVVEFGLG